VAVLEIIEAKIVSTRRCDVGGALASQRSISGGVHMGVLQQNNIDKKQIGPERERYLCHTDHLMMVVIDFNDGPTAEPDPPHSHHHEQISYVAAGEIIVVIGGEAARLGPGDMFTVPPDVPHTLQLLTKHVRLVDTFTPLRPELLE